MRRAPIVLLAGIAALGLAWLLSRGGGTAMLRAYLPAWLFALAVPLGALPLVLFMELGGMGQTPLAAALRRLLPALPPMALLALPLLLHVDALYGWASQPLGGFAGRWLQPGPFVLREAAFLSVWAVLGLVFAWPPSPRSRAWRPGLAIVGLMLHLAMGTLAAVDWAMSLQPGLNSSTFGLLLMVGQSGAALAAAVLLAAALGDDRAVVAAARPLLVLLGLWAFLQFAQYLIVWSANLPAEIASYRQRDTGLGQVAEWLALACCLFASVLLPRGPARNATVVTAVAGAVLLLHLVEVWWLVTPAWGGRVAVGGADLLPTLGLGGIVASVLLAFRGPLPTRQGGSLARA